MKSLSSIHIPRIALLLAFAFLLAVSQGCKSNKKAMAAAKAKAQQEEALRKQREREEAAMREAEEKARIEEEKRKAAETRPESNVNTTSVKLEQYFSAISNASATASANSSINEALTMFTSDQTPVLIVINEEGGMKDYDKPTTIKAYLNYLKDQKKNLNKINELEFDETGKIKSVELIRKK